ncbi:alpha-amylase [Photobacterium sagamiensis]|uniref:alpha-amylase n=1 Tax=Photobacterium sagamiensis TaxID=2910241 RepID=UPI003D0B7F6F
MKRTLSTLALMAALPATTLPAMAAPSITVATPTNSRDYPLSADSPLVVPLNKAEYTLTVSGLEGDCTAEPVTKVKFNQQLGLNCGENTALPIKIRFSGDYAFHFDANANTLLIKRQPKKSKTEFKRPLPKVSCDVYSGGEISVRLEDTFPDGTWLRDAYSGNKAKVKNGQIALTPAAESGGLLLLEPVEKVNPEPQGFEWRNANIYFVMVDRFNNGNTENDHSYGRKKDGKDEVATFHGGDLAGITAKLDYIKSLGTNAIWLSPIVEQVHGFVGGGESGSFPFYAYHGYWTRDFTRLDANFGSEDDLQTLVTEAHKRGIKILMDAVINHPGYSTLADLQNQGIKVINPESELPSNWGDWKPGKGENWHGYHKNIDYSSPNWANWWGGDWVRAGLPGYPAPGSGDLTLTLAGLPDFRTESEDVVKPPQWLLNNPGTRVVNRDNYRVADYLVEWQSDWVKRFGIDGFRVDTVKHVTGDVWKQLKQQATASLETWRKDNKVESNTPFWMMGEVWGHGPSRSFYYDDGFDALINFDMQKKVDPGAFCFSEMADTYQYYADNLAKDQDFNAVSYLSSHDTELYFNRYKSFEMQRGAATALLLSPGAVQVYYGDEVAREHGPYADDFHHGTRSDMNWKPDTERQSLLKHWQKLGQFRQSHPAIGAGQPNVLPQDQGYAFSRELNGDKVVVVFAGKQK